MPTVHLRMSDGAQFSVEIADLGETTVESFKETISASDKANAPSSALKLVYRGQILKDEKTLGDYGVIDGHTIHVVKSRAATSPAPSMASSSTTGASSTTSAAPAGTNAANPFAAMFGGAGMGGMDNANNTMTGGGRAGAGMNSLMEQMLSNSGFMQNMIQSSPQLRRVMEDNPELARAMNDPELMRSAMRAATDPEYRREMLRRNDLAMANVQNMPGGFDALNRMYHEIQDPLENGIQEAFDQASNNPMALFGGSNTTSMSQGQTHDTDTNSNVSPSDAPIPNPWRSSSSTTPSAPGANPFAFGGAPGGAGGGAPDMQAAMGMLQNPMTQQFVVQMLSNPEYMRMMEESNPMLRNLLNSQPGMREMLQNPEFVRSMISMTSSMGGAGGANPMAAMMGGAGGANPMAAMMGGAGGAGGANPMAAMMGAMGGASGTSTSTSSTDTAANPFAAMMAAMGGGSTPGTCTSNTGTASNPFAAMMGNTAGTNPSTTTTGTTPTTAAGGGNPMFGGMDMAAFQNMMQGMGGGVPTQGAQPSNVNYEELYAGQLRQMRDLGFTDTQACINALKSTGGNVEAAINRLFGE